MRNILCDNALAGWLLEKRVKLGKAFALIAVVCAFVGIKTYCGNGLRSSAIKDKHIIASIIGFQCATTQLALVMNSRPQNMVELEQRLAEKGIFIVARFDCGLTRFGSDLSFGEQLIIRYFESFYWIFSMHYEDVYLMYPKTNEVNADAQMYVLNWAKAELNRMNIVITELRKEGKRRGLNLPVWETVYLSDGFD